MKQLSCPHCGSGRIGANRVPKDVVVVLPCPACQGLVVIFRNKAAAANREILENGTKEECKAHIAEIVMEFLDALVFRSFPLDRFRKGKDIEPDLDDLDDEVSGELEGMLEADSGDGSITQREIDRFVKVELQRIDDSRYFKKHFN
jgi:hypothetical protein